MSFYRLTFYSAMVGGWAAFIGWLLGEVLLMRRANPPAVWALVVTAALCGMFIGGGLNFLAGIATGQMLRAVPRLLFGLGVGLIAGAFGSWCGNFLYGFLPRILGLAIGWLVMGLCIGCVEGLYDLNWRKIRNGVLGGGVGGLVGGLVFGPLDWLIGSPMSARAMGLTILGMCIGLLIGLAQVMLREAWLTVEEGFRPGRQLLLSRGQTMLGTSEKAQLIFIAVGAKGVEPLHVCVARLEDGGYAARDNGSRTGTFVNDRPISNWVRLRSGDLIRFGINKVRFHERQRFGGGQAPARVAAAVPVDRPPPMALPVNAIAVPRQPPMAKPAPVAVPMAKPAPMAVPMAKPAPPPMVVPIAKPMAPPRHPATAAQQVSQQGASECPVCGTRNAGAAGKRRCENCGVVF